MEEGGHMSDENTARHAECTVEFDGVDITSSIMPYPVSYTHLDVYKRQ